MLVFVDRGLEWVLVGLNVFSWSEHKTHHKIHFRPEYKTLDWKSKHDLVWNKVTADSTMGQSYPTDAFTESLMTVFENEWDFLPEGRRKVRNIPLKACGNTLSYLPLALGVKI